MYLHLYVSPGVYPPRRKEVRSSWKGTSSSDCEVVPWPSGNILVHAPAGAPRGRALTPSGRRAESANRTTAAEVSIFCNKIRAGDRRRRPPLSFCAPVLYARKLRMLVESRAPQSDWSFSSRTTTKEGFYPLSVSPPPLSTKSEIMNCLLIYYMLNGADRQSAQTCISWHIFTPEFTLVKLPKYNSQEAVVFGSHFTIEYHTFICTICVKVYMFFA